MNITWHGHYTIKIVSQGSTLLINPHSAETGLVPLRTKAEIISLTNPAIADMSHTAGVGTDAVIIKSPGEYALRDMRLYARGWWDKANTEHNIQRWHIEDMILLHPGAIDLGLAEEHLKELENINIDILLLPIGGGNSLNTAQALTVLTTIEPRIVIPIHYQLPRLKQKLDTLDQFAKEMGIKVSEASQPRLNISSRKLPPEGPEIIILTP